MKFADNHPRIKTFTNSYRLAHRIVYSWMEYPCCANSTPSSKAKTLASAVSSA
ncbi:MAG: hypothetical protein HS100_17110 [Anaerolineales bacterium]|nr:hypothetical protein [Anaerolineales bacterium]